MEDEKLASYVSAGRKKRAAQADLTALLEHTIPDAVAAARAGDRASAVEKLLAAEKIARQAEDPAATSKVACAILGVCWDARDVAMLVDHLSLLAKRRGQLKTAVQNMVRQAMSYADDLAGDQRVKLLEVLRTITEGKIFVELERARITKTLAGIHEAAGELKVASKLLQEIQVETYGSMDKREKTAFLMEQVRLCLDTDDYIRSFILSNKVNRKTLLDTDMEDLKKTFYMLMIRYWSHEENHLEVARCYLHIYDTPSVQADEAEWRQALCRVVAHLVLAQHDSDRSDLSARVLADKRTTDLPEWRALLLMFAEHEHLAWSSVRDRCARLFEPLALPAWAETLRTRVVEHNVRVVARYYTQVRLARLAELLELDAAAAEEAVARLVVSPARDVFARIDRPNGIVRFGRRQDASETLDGWARQVSDLVSLVDDTCHLIHRENAAYKIRESA
eukprot:m51a1_g12186 putative 26s proteasome non-atpase regulatory subunit 12 (450) ;mRNA; r:6568-8753